MGVVVFVVVFIAQLTFGFAVAVNKKCCILCGVLFLCLLSCQHLAPSANQNTQKSQNSCLDLHVCVCVCVFVCLILCLRSFPATFTSRLEMQIAFTCICLDLTFR